MGDNLVAKTEMPGYISEKLEAHISKGNKIITEYVGTYFQVNLYRIALSVCVCARERDRLKMSRHQKAERLLLYIHHHSSVWCSCPFLS